MSSKVKLLKIVDKDGDPDIHLELKGTQLR